MHAVVKDYATPDSNPAVVPMLGWVNTGLLSTSEALSSGEERTAVSLGKAVQCPSTFRRLQSSAYRLHIDYEVPAGATLVWSWFNIAVDCNVTGRVTAW